MRGRVQRDPFPGFSWVGVKQRVSISRKVLLLVISLALLAGAWCSLIYLGVLSAPAFFKDIPVVNRLVDTSDVTTSKSSPVEQEKRQLLERIKSLQGKMTKLEQQVREKETELQQAYDDALEKMATLWADLALQEAQVQLQNAQLERETVRLGAVREQARIGAVTQIDLVQAELSHLQAEVAAQKALFDYQLAYVKLLAAAGDHDTLARLEDAQHD